jgi:arabinogalactan endo-1,4-beta-galactosidase
MRRITLIVVLFLSIFGACLMAQGISIRPVEGLGSRFIMGADVSMLDRIESLGGKYYRESGKDGDCLAILKENGINWIRLRIWNDPRNAADVVEGGKLLSKAGDPVGGGNNDLAVYIRIAKRAKKLGLKVQADFHYSDFWADPSKQTMPKAWVGLGLEELKVELYKFTDASLKAMRAAGVMPDMVQVGNEVDDGFLWPVGKIYPANASQKVGGSDAFAALIKEAIRAVRDNDPAKANPAKRIRVMIQASSGGDNDKYRKLFDLLIKNGVDFDVIGLSFYPYWHGKVSDLSANMADLATRYGKEMLVTETAYAWTLESGDSFPDAFGLGSDRLGGYKATPQGQATSLCDIIAAVAGVAGGKGIGVVYWEPDWIPVEGAGWRTGEGNNWENQALFDFKGRALPSLKVFKLVRAKGEMPDLRVESIEGVKIKMPAGGVLSLPGDVLAAYSDDSYRPTQVMWEKPDPSALAKVGSITIKGSVPGFAGEAVASVEVVIDSNLIPDSSFESKGLAAGGWKLEGPQANAALVEKNPGNAHSGDYSFKYWLGESFKFTLTRSFTGLKDGTYAFRAWAMGGGGEKAYSIFARNYAPGGEGPALSEKIVNTGWQKWKLYEIKGVKVKGGSCEIGLDMDGNSGNWGNVDDVEFVRESD